MTIYKRERKSSKYAKHNREASNVKRVIEGITKKLKDKYRPEKIILFGSYAYGNPRKDSDIDLLIIKKTKVRHADRILNVRKIIREENRYFAIEPLVYTPQEIKKRLEMGDVFFKTIINKGVNLYG